MTTKAWAKFLIWVKSERKPLQGSIALYPHSYKFIKDPSYWQTEWMEQGRDIHFYAETLNIVGDSLKVKGRHFDQQIKKPSVVVPYRHIKTMRIYGYNN